MSHVDGRRTPWPTRVAPLRHSAWRHSGFSRTIECDWHRARVAPSRWYEFVCFLPIHAYCGDLLCWRFSDMRMCNLVQFASRHKHYVSTRLPWCFVKLWRWKMPYLFFRWCTSVKKTDGRCVDGFSAVFELVWPLHLLKNNQTCWRVAPEQHLFEGCSNVLAGCGSGG